LKRTLKLGAVILPKPSYSSRLRQEDFEFQASMRKLAGPPSWKMIKTNKTERNITWILF
jgi:hypothetical protein